MKIAIFFFVAVIVLVLLFYSPLFLLIWVFYNLISKFFVVDPMKQYIELQRFRSESKK